MTLQEYSYLCAVAGTDLPCVIKNGQYKNSTYFMRHLARHCMENYYHFYVITSEDSARVQNSMNDKLSRYVSKNTYETLFDYKYQSVKAGIDKFNSNYKKKIEEEKVVLEYMGEIQAAIAFTCTLNGKQTENLLEMRYLRSPKQCVTSEIERRLHVSHSLYYMILNKALDTFAVHLFIRANDRIPEIPDARKTYAEYSSSHLLGH